MESSQDSGGNRRRAKENHRRNAVIFLWSKNEAKNDGPPEGKQK